jgi:DNA-binding PadR family transcriptional regulator
VLLSKKNHERDYYSYLGKDFIIFLVLLALNHKSDEESKNTAYNLIQKIRKDSRKISGSGEIVLRAGSLYSLVQKMEESGWINRKYEDWGEKTGSKKAVYTLTDDGRAELLKMSVDWNNIKQLIQTYEDQGVS